MSAPNPFATQIQVIVTGGHPGQRFPRIATATISLAEIHSVSSLIESLKEKKDIVDPLWDIYRLKIDKDHKIAIFYFTNNQSIRQGVPLQHYIDDVGVVKSWKTMVEEGQLSVSPPCECNNLGSPCRGSYHSPEIHVSLKLDHLIKQVDAYSKVDDLNLIAVRRLEDKIADQDELIEKVEHKLYVIEKTHEIEQSQEKSAEGVVKIKVEKLCRENGELKNEILALRMTNEEYEQELQKHTRKNRTKRRVASAAIEESEGDEETDQDVQPFARKVATNRKALRAQKAVR